MSHNGLLVSNELILTLPRAWTKYPPPSAIPTCEGGAPGRDRPAVQEQRTHQLGPARGRGRVGAGPDHPRRGPLFPAGGSGPGGGNHPPGPDPAPIAIARILHPPPLAVARAAQNADDL